MVRARIRFRSHTLRKSVACGALLGALACQDAPEHSAPSATVAKSPAVPAAAAEPAPSKDPASPPSQDELVARGKSVYNSNCIACHNPDPAQDGAIGPANAGSSMALLEAKVIHNTYPPGYTPKRNTRAMIALPHLAGEIPALHAFLNASN